MCLSQSSPGGVVLLIAILKANLLVLDTINILNYLPFPFKMPATTRNALQLTEMMFLSDEFSGINDMLCM